MRIDVELDRNETDLLLFMLGAGIGNLRHLKIADIDRMLAIVNKLMQQNPDFTPYAVTPEKRVH